jgi:hypothetical protein
MPQQQWMTYNKIVVTHRIAASLAIFPPQYTHLRLRSVERGGKDYLHLLLHTEIAKSLLAFQIYFFVLITSTPLYEQ